MRPSDMIFEGQETLPAPLFTLVRELRQGGGEAPAHVLTPLAALEEVVAAGNSLIEGRGASAASDRRSLRKDLSEALNAIGPSLQAQTRAVLRAFQEEELGRLEGLLADVEGARRARAAAQQLLDELSLPKAARAAWSDCVAAFESDTDSESCQLRIAQLREIAERRGHGWDALEHSLSRLLADDLYAAAERGAVELDADAEPEPRQRAGLPLDRRLALCNDLVGETPPEADIIVWLVFAHAHLRDGFLRLGPVQFFRGELFPEHVRDGCPALNAAEFERPLELADPLAGVHFDHLPTENRVFVRVNLGHGPVAGARERARDLVLGLVETASVESGWVLLKGEAAYSSRGGWWGSLGFSDPQEMDRVRRFGDPVHDHTSDDLAKVDQRFAEALARGEEDALNALRELRWDHALRGAHDPAHQVALATRILERALPVPRAANLNLRDACERHLKEQWCFRTFSSELFDAAYHGIWALSRGDEQAQWLFAELQQAVIPDKGNLAFGFHPGPFMERAGELESALPEHSMHRRMASDAHQHTKHGRAARARLQDLERRFDQLLARSIRQRNAVVHGGITVPAVVESCQQFIRELVATVVAQMVAAAARGEDLLKRLEAARAAWLRQLEALERGQPPGMVLFSGDMRN